MVDPGGDQRLKRVRHPVRGAAARPALDEHSDRLLDEQRVSLGPIERLLRKRGGPLARRTGELAQQLLDELRALLLGEGLQLDRRRAHAAAAPAGPRVEELGPGQAEDEHRCAHAVRDVLDQVEERRLRPVDVLEEQDQRLHVCDAVHHLARGPGDLLWAPLALEGFHQSGRQPEHVRDSLLGAALAQLFERLLERVVVRDAGRSLHHLGERPVRDAFAVGKRSTHEHARSLHAVEELSRQAALSDTGLAVDREQMRAAVAEAALERVLEELELVLPADERSARAERPRRPVEHVDDAPCAQRPVDPLELERPGVLDDEGAGSEAVRRRPHEDLSRSCSLLQSRGEIHGLPGREGRLGAVDDDLARLDPDPRLEPKLVHRVTDCQSRTCRALGVVLVRLWNAERGHDGVAGELLHDPAVYFDAMRDLLEELRDPPPDDLRVRALSRAESSRRGPRTALMRACAPCRKCRNDGGGD